MLYWLGYQIGRFLGRRQVVIEEWKKLMAGEVLKLTLMCDYLGLPREIGYISYQQHLARMGAFTQLEIIRHTRDCLFMGSPEAN